MAPVTREEHLEWCKKRAREFLRLGDIKSAIASMLSDLGKHEETKGAAMTMAPLGLYCAIAGDFDGARQFIEGFR